MKTCLATLFCCSVLLAGCQWLPGAPDATPAVVRLQGALEQAGAHWQLAPCDGSQPVPLVFPAAWEPAIAHCGEPQQPHCFADLELHPDTTVASPVRHVHRIQTRGPGCADEEFQHLLIGASGNQPLWSLRLSRQGLILQQPGRPALALPYIHEQLGDGLHYISSQADHQALQLWISPQPCTDSVSGSWHALSARLQWQGQTFTGCAYQGAQQATAP